MSENTQNAGVVARIYTRVKRFFLKHEELRWLGVLYLALAFINLRTKLQFAPSWHKGTLVRNHNLLMDFNYLNNEQSRLLQFYVPEGLQRVFGVSIVDSYMWQRLIFTTLFFVLFHRYLRRWFTPALSFAAVALAAAILPLGSWSDLQESSSLLLVTFLLALWAIRDRNLPLLLGSYTVGGLNNESMMAVPLVYFTANFKSWRIGDLARLIGKTLLTSLPLLIIVPGMRYITRDNKHLSGYDHISRNFNNLIGNFDKSFWDQIFSGQLYPLIIFNVMWICAWFGLRKQPPFMRRAAWLIPAYTICNLIAGELREVRLFVPLAILIIPMAFFHFFRNEIDREGLGEALAKR